MKSQKKIWEEEHKTQKTFTRTHSQEPSAPIPDFTDFLESQGLVPSKTKVLDIGCGKGRNSIYLALKGFQIVGVDFAPQAIKEAKERSKAQVVFKVVDLTKNWPFEDAHFDAVIDCNTTICIPNPGRKKAVIEAHRVLKPGGYYLFYGVATTEMVQKFPGSEPNSCIFPRTGKFERQYTKKELIQTYKSFDLVNLKRINGSDIIEGKSTKFSLWVGLFKK